MKKLLLLLFIPLISIGQEVELTALRLSNNFSKPNRVLKTTISDKSFFEQNYNDTNLTLDYVIRYHFYTSIKLNARENKLISMDGTNFNLSSKNAADLTDEVISLVSKMYFGKKEFDEFKELNKKKKVRKNEFLYSIKIADFYYKDSAENMILRIKNETNLKNPLIKKLSKTKYRVLLGPFSDIKKLEQSFDEIKLLEFENLEILKDA